MNDPARPELRSFDKVLVANRGEIARRILRSVRELGLRGVAVYSDADATEPHVREADEAVRIGGAAPAESYLNADRLIEAARAVGAGAVHPGYGFLSERADFAQRCLDAGLVFIGPSPQAIARMGGKIESKRIAAQAGVPVLDGFATEVLAPEALRARADALGYPLLIKASAGGGGRGMRIVHGAGELEGALASAAREARSAFGDGALLIERYLTGARHVEVQIFADQHGGAIHCFERECSIQRRHQKLIEEAPSPALDPALRARMGTAAVALARAIDYTGAGTVEFALDAGGAFYFLEMNTRLQVEHPVTEAITGLDLVRMQIEVAQGRPLAVTQEQLAMNGHAIEARLYAEDPARDFLPVSGRVALFRPPVLPGLRVDGGVETGSEVSVHYDALLAKVIAHGGTREEARRWLIRGLRSLGAGGLTTNREFLLQVLEHPNFIAGAIDTHFVDRHLPPELRHARPEAGALRAHAVAAVLYLHERRRAAGSPVPASILSGFRNNRVQPQEERFTAGDVPVRVQYVAHPDRVFAMHVDGSPLTARLIDAGADSVTAEIDNVRRRYALAQDGERLVVHGGEHCLELTRAPRFPARASAQQAGGCAAPMTGVVREVCVAIGQRVARGDVMVVLEAMKMEHRLTAQAAGVVTAVRAVAGKMVDPDDVLVVVEPDPEAE
jgi:propionyl-CoA carboxylase alpha chain